jgi:2-dehydro-3-deoxyphosphooctonate aldolase (KDO 8-P synthase)
MSGILPETRRIEHAGVVVGGGALPLVIAGPDTLESRDLVLEVAEVLAGLARRLGICAVFKGSYDKANRSSHLAYRGPGIEKGLELLALVKSRTGLPVTSDVHAVCEVERAAAVLDIVQVPAFLCRQNDLLAACGATGKIVNIKKGQFLAPGSVAARVAAASGPRTPGVLVTERGTSFGHGDLVNDFRGVPEIRAMGTPVVYDATHSVQRPGALGDKSGGNRDLIPFLARAAAGAGCDGFFFEVHPDPDRALCDGPNSLRLADLEPLVAEILAIDRISRRAERA